MANDVVARPENQSGIPNQGGHELDAFLGRAFEEKPIWSELWENVKDVFFPPGWTSLVPMSLNGDFLTDLLSYNATTGQLVATLGQGPGQVPTSAPADGALRLDPVRHDTDGFYAAVLRRVR